MRIQLRKTYKHININLFQDDHPQPPATPPPKALLKRVKRRRLDTINIKIEITKIIMK